MISAYLEDKNVWLLKLDDINDHCKYTMQWNIMCEYVDVQVDTYKTCNLLDKTVDLSTNQATCQNQV